MAFTAQVCECAPLTAAAASSNAWCSDACSVDDDTGDNSGVSYNIVSSRAVIAACGRVYHPSNIAAARICEHFPGEAARCSAISAAATSALADLYVGRGDEGDHHWLPFVAPLLEGEVFDVVDETGLVRCEALHAACGGALWSELRFRVCALQTESDRLVEEGDEEERPAIEAAAWRAAEAAMRAHGAERITFFRPIENDRSANRGCVFPFFVVGVTPAGSLAGVSGLTVWT